MAPKTFPVFFNSLISLISIKTKSGFFFFRSFNSDGDRRRYAKVAGSFYPTDNYRIGFTARIRNEKEWLNWIENNDLAVYDLSQKIISINMNWYRGTKHEIRLKSQFVALQAKNPRSLIVNESGYLTESFKDVDPFSEGITSFQIRYKYEIVPLSYIYLVYTKGGSIFENNIMRETSEIFKDPWNNPDNEIFSIKFRLKY